MSPLAQGKPPQAPPPKFVWTVCRRLGGDFYYTTSFEAWGKSEAATTRCPKCRKVLHWKHFDFGGESFGEMKPGETREIPCKECGARLKLVKGWT